MDGFENLSEEEIEKRAILLSLGENVENMESNVNAPAAEASAKKEEDKKA